MQIGDAMREYGVHVAIYEAYSTNSVYLKFDNGVGNSLRISDHGGKKHLSYRYNIDLNYKGDPKNISGKFPRFKYGADDRGVELLISKIQRDISKKRVSYGGKYKDYMDENARKGSEQKGFWQQAMNYDVWRKAQ